MNNIRQRFTSWYRKKGYQMDYMPYTGELIFRCPPWVRPLVFLLFSPCAYYREFVQTAAEE
jgi:hypothetical protein